MACVIACTTHLDAMARFDDRDPAAQREIGWIDGERRPAARNERAIQSGVAQHDGAPSAGDFQPFGPIEAHDAAVTRRRPRTGVLIASARRRQLLRLQRR